VGHPRAGSVLPSSAGVLRRKSSAFTGTAYRWRYVRRLPSTTVSPLGVAGACVCCLPGRVAPRPLRPVATYPLVFSFPAGGWWWPMFTQHSGGADFSARYLRHEYCLRWRYVADGTSNSWNHQGPKSCILHTLVARGEAVRPSGQGHCRIPRREPPRKARPGLGKRLEPNRRQKILSAH